MGLGEDLALSIGSTAKLKNCYTQTQTTDRAIKYRKSVSSLIVLNEEVIKVLFFISSNLMVIVQQVKIATRK